MDDEQLRAQIDRCSEEKYADYIESCKEMGYTVDAEEDSEYTYRAYSEEGYCLELTSFSSGEKFSITLSAPLEMGEITWPSAGAGSLVPAPESSTGLIDSDSSTFFVAYVGNTNPEAFSSYVDACSNAGFTVDYDRGDAFYQADNADGANLRLDYEGFNIMTVRVSIPEDSTVDSSSTQDSASSPDSGEATDSGTVSADFKATMDEYEAFFDEYIEFMELYSANPSDAELLAQYGDYMSQYADTMAAMDSIDTNNLSAEDQAYFIEVQNRINQKLLNASL